MIIHIYTQTQQHTNAHLIQLLHNESPPGPSRPPESPPPSPGGSSSASRLSAGAAPARAGSVACYAAGVLLAAFAALVALPLSGPGADRGLVGHADCKESWLQGARLQQLRCD